MTVPFPPILTLTSSSTELTPDFDIDLPSGAGDATDAAVGDVLVVQYSVDDGFNWSLYFTDTLDSSDVIATTLTETATPLAYGSYVFRGRFERASVPSEWSNYVVVTIDLPRRRYKYAAFNT